MNTYCFDGPVFCPLDSALEARGEIQIIHGEVWRLRGVRHEFDVPIPFPFDRVDGLARYVVASMEG